MQDDFAERGIDIMAMGSPTAGTKVHLHVAGLRRFVTKLKDRLAKIRPSLQIVKTGMKNFYRLTVQRLKLVSKQPLMQPDCLQQALRR